MPTIPQNLDNMRLTGQTSVGTTAVPVTKIGDTSSASTSFTPNAVRDGNAWDTSAVGKGDVAVTSDGYKGIITVDPAGGQTLTIGDGWMSPTGRLMHKHSSVKPADGSTVTIHRISRAAHFAIKAAAGNTMTLYFSRNAAVVATDLQLRASQQIPLLPQGDKKFIDITKVYAKSPSGTQSLSWIVGGS